MRLEHWLYTLPLRLRSIFRRNKVDQDLTDELRFHLDQRIAAEIAAGKSPDDARRAALRAMDNITLQAEQCRDTRGVSWSHHLALDLRYGARVLRKNPAFTAVAVLTLTLGIGANTAIFSVVNAVLLRPLPYPQPAQLVRIYETNTSIPASHDSVSAPNFIDWRARSRSFSNLAALRWQPFTLTGAATPEFVYGNRVTPGTLNILGIAPAIGRDFSPDDAVPGRARVALLSHELWTRRFAADPAILGREITLDFEPYTIIGILPPGFRAPSQFGSTEPVELLTPLVFSSDELQKRGDHNSQVFARLRPGVTPAQAQSEMDEIAAQLAREFSNNEGRGARVVPLLEEITGGYRRSLLVIFAAAGLILLISCANLANALLARGAGQQREIAVRLALGAGRPAIVRQILAQNLILALLGCASGILAALWAVKALHALAPANLPRLEEVSLDWPTLAFAVAASLATGIAFGLFPALSLSASRAYDAMKGRGPSASTSTLLRWRSALVIAQVALSIVLLVGAGLLLKSFARLRGIDIGFQPSRTLAMKIMLPRSRYQDQAKCLRFFDDLTLHLAALPGIEAAGFTNQLPMRGGWGGSFKVEQPEVPMGPNDDSDFQIVSPGYFRALGIRLLRGRFFNDADQPGALPVVLVNRAFAHRYWPNTNPLGQHLTKGNSPPLTIVGIVDDVHLEGPAKPANIEIYFASGQAQSLPVRPSDLAVRVSADPLNFVLPIQREVWALDKEQPITAIRTMDEVLDQSTARTRFNSLLLTLFAALALLLAVVGIYGIVSYAVSQRAPEIGIRMALGARPRQVLTLVFRQAAYLIGAGAILGIAASLALSRYAGALLFQVTPRDPASFAAAIALLLTTGLAAALLPARRATQIAPLSILRTE